MTVAICIAGMAHTPLATHPRVASPHDSPSAEGGGGPTFTSFYYFTVLLFLVFLPAHGSRHAAVYGVRGDRSYGPARPREVFTLIRPLRGDVARSRRCCLLAQRTVSIVRVPRFHLTFYWRIDIATSTSQT